MELDGRVAVITGAAGNAGPAVVRALADAGARVALVGSRREPLEQLASELGLAPDTWSANAADLRDAAASAAVVDEVVGRMGRVDILAHFVGGWAGGSAVVDTADDEFTRMLDQHLWTTRNVVRAVVPRMTEAGWGRIVAVSSPVATQPTARSSPYAVGKAAQEALLGALAREVTGTGVTVNVLHVRTVDAARERVTAPGPKNASWTTPEEIAAAVCYLCTDEANRVNGARIPLYG